uniref:Uncharacterized protein n=1 Tax=Rhizophora mucronata TaxID=61149 RepID=A0A2P2QP07_RHIMU
MRKMRANKRLVGYKALANTGMDHI